ncbi:MAG: hypothetical protein MJ236_03610 [Clostridia bacterium]|nr:hypothetical protein [Clostridia bacterium]
MAKVLFDTDKVTSMIARIAHEIVERNDNITDVVLVGVGSRIEIWDKDKYEAITADENMDDISGAMEALGLTI